MLYPPFWIPMSCPCNHQQTTGAMGLILFVSVKISHRVAGQTLLLGSPGQGLLKHGVHGNKSANYPRDATKCVAHR